MSFFSRFFRMKRPENTKIESLIKQLKRDMSRHEGVGPPLTTQDVEEFEKRIDLHIPPSFGTFLTKFGDGAYWLYGCQPIDSSKNPFWLRDTRPNAPAQVPLEGAESVEIDTLLCLMTEDSNGGAWCWLTSLRTADGEWPLAYFMDGKLFYQVESFTRWLAILVRNQQEVIRVLDVEERLDLG